MIRLRMNGRVTAPSRPRVLAVLVVLISAVTGVRSLGNCDEDIANKTSGVVTSPNYGYGYSSARPRGGCFWRVTVTPGNRIRVEFLAPFDINTLGYDLLYIYDGPGPQSDALYERLKGKIPPEDFITSGNSVYVRLRLLDTGYYLPAKGFRFTFKEIGPVFEEIPTVSVGLITTWNYPAEYLGNEDYTWRISVPEGMHIQLTFSDFGIQNGDRLSLYPGHEANESRLIWMLTRDWQDPRYNPVPRSTMPDIFIPENSALITLQTLHRGKLAINYRGLDVTPCPTVPPPAHGTVRSPQPARAGSRAEFTCDPGFTLLGPATLTCQKDDVTTPYWDGVFPVCLRSSPCVSRVQIVSGSSSLSSPGYPSPFPGSADCAWYIHTRSEYQMHVSFAPTFSLGDAVLELFDGGGPAALRFASFTGNLKPAPFLSSSNQLFLRFSGNGSSSTGFSLTYDVFPSQAALCGKLFADQASGFILSPGYPEVVTRNTHCSWTIRVRPGHVVQLQATKASFSKESAVVTAYSGTSAEGRFAGRFDDSDKTLMSNGPLMYVELDASAQPLDVPGFMLTFREVPLEVEIAHTAEGAIESPNFPFSAIFPYNPSQPSVFWWNLTAPASDQRFTFQISDRATIYNSILSFFEYVSGRWTQIANVTRTTMFNSLRTINIESSTSSVFVRLSKVSDSVFRVRYKAFPANECPPLLMEHISDQAAGHVIGDAVNATCSPGYNVTVWSKIHRQSQVIDQAHLICLAAGDEHVGGVWDNRQFICRENPCHRMVQKMNDTYGYVTPVGFPGMAESGRKCWSTISVAADHRIALRFTAFALGYDSKFELIENNRRLLQLGHRDRPPITTSTTNKVTIFSDFAGPGPGFRIIYQAVAPAADSPALLNHTLCPHPGGIKNGTWDKSDQFFQIGELISYSCEPGRLLVGYTDLRCASGADGVALWDHAPPYCSVAATRKCNRTITSGSGSLSPLMLQDYELCDGLSQTWPCSYRNKKYLNSQDCRVWFDLPPGFIVQFERTSKYSLDLIDGDTILVYDGLGTDQPLLLNLSYTSTRAQPEDAFPHKNFHSPGNKLLFRFISNDDSAARGFSLRYSVIKSTGCPDPPASPRFGWVQTTRDSGPYEDGDRRLYGCVQTYNRTGDVRKCNGTAHEWTGQQSLCRASHYYSRELQTTAMFYTPDYPDPYYHWARGSWTFRAPPGKGIEMYFRECSFQSWDDGLFVYDSEGLVAKTLYAKEWYVMNRLNVDPTYIRRFTTNWLRINFMAKSRYRNERTKCDVQMKVFDLPESCDSPVPGTHQTLTGGGYKVGQSVRVLCGEGFYLPDGGSSTSITCAHDRKWSPPVPDCQAPCGKILSADSGVIYSPNYPGLYKPFDRNCVWRIKGPVGTVVVLNFTSLDVRTGSVGYRDTVSAQDGEGAYARWLFQNLTGSHGSFSHVTQSNMAVITMHISKNRQTLPVQGFTVFYRVYSPYICPPLSPVPFLERRDIVSEPENGTVTVRYTCHYPFSVIGQTIITCLPEGRWDYPEPTCAGSCGGTSNRTSGLVISPGFPEAVTDQQSCLWDLQGPGINGIGMRVDLRNVSLAVGDVLEFYDGNWTREMPKRFTWSSLPDDVCSTSLHVSLRLVPGDADAMSDVAVGGRRGLAPCSDSPMCRCRVSANGCTLCRFPSGVSEISKCLENSNSSLRGDTGRSINCTILGIVRAFSHLFGGENVTGIDMSMNCSDGAANVTTIDPAVLRCLESATDKPCVPCRPAPPPAETNFTIAFSANIPLGRCDISELTFPHMKGAFLSGRGDWAEVGEKGLVYCDTDYAFRGDERNGVVCGHTGRWDLHDGVKCTCDESLSYTEGGFVSPAYYMGGYSNNQRCVYNVSLDPGNIVKIRIKGIRLKENDTLVVYDGLSSDAGVLAVFEDVYAPPDQVLYSSGPNVRAVFTSDDRAVDQGVKVEYWGIPPACRASGHQTVTLGNSSDRAVVRIHKLRFSGSPQCTWLIIAPENHLVNISTGPKGSWMRGTIETGIYEGDRLSEDTLTSSHTSPELLADPFTSRTRQVWLRLALQTYTVLDIAIAFSVVVPCERPSPPDHGCVISSRAGFSRGEVIPLGCDSGYSLGSDSAVTCEEAVSGVLMWSAPVPACVPTGGTNSTCPKPTTTRPVVIAPTSPVPPPPLSSKRPPLTSKLPPLTDKPPPTSPSTIRATPEDDTTAGGRATEGATRPQTAKIADVPAPSLPQTEGKGTSGSESAPGCVTLVVLALVFYLMCLPNAGAGS